MGHTLLDTVPVCSVGLNTMKEHIKVNDKYATYEHTYWYESVSLAKHDVAMYRDYMPYIKHMVRHNMHDIFQRHTEHEPLLINTAYNCRVRFSVPLNIHFYLEHPADRLVSMENSVIPPRHIWDKDFPGSMGFVTTIYRKVASRARRHSQITFDSIKYILDNTETATTTWVVDGTVN